MTNFRPGGLQQLPVVIKNLLIINVLVFLIQQACEAKGIPIDDYFALHYWASPNFHWWQLFTHMFMHGNIMHIFFNMFALWMFGRILENVWGPKRFLFFYLICGLGAAICHLAVLSMEYVPFHNAFMAYQEQPTFVNYAQFINHNHLTGISEFNQIMNFWSANPDCNNCVAESVKLIHIRYMDMVNEATIGASGAVFGVLFAFGYLFPNTELILIFPPMPVKAKWVVTVYALIELYGGIRNSAGDNIAHFAHLGGMLFAFILLRIWKNTVRNRFY